MSPEAQPRPPRPIDAADLANWTNPYSFNPTSDVSPTSGLAGDQGEDVSPVTVPTDALTSVVLHLSGYLEADPAPAGQGGGPSQGRVITIVGEAGMGKTHLARDLFRRTEQVPDAQGFYVEAGLSDEPFRQLYLRFLLKLRSHELKDQINRLYTEVVVRDLASSRMTERLAHSVTSGELTADDVVNRFEMSRSNYEQRLEDDLTALLDGDRDTARVFTLFREPQLDDLVWAWLQGKTPAAVMDRGITRSIDTEERAVQALGQLIRLLTVGRRKIVLVIDEAQNLLLTEDSRPLPGRRLAALRLLLDTLRPTQAFVAFCGLPEFYDWVPEAVQQRLDPRILMAPFGRQETREYVVLVNRLRPQPGAVPRQDDITPFTEGSLAAATDSANGIPRQVISLLAHGYQRWKLESRPVTEDMILDAAREHDGAVSGRAVRASIVAVLYRLGLDFRSNHPVTDDVRVDFWVLNPRPSGPSWGIEVTRAVEAQVDADQVLNIGRALNATSGSPLLLVVHGGLSAERRAQMQQQLRVEPVSYLRGEFEATLETILARAFDVTTRSETEADGSQVAEGLQLLDRRQTLTYDSLLELTGQVEALRVASESGFDALRNEVQRLVSRSALEAEQAPDELPTDVERLFRSARASLEQAVGVQRVLTGAFLATETRSDSEQAIVAGIRTALRAADVTSAIGLVSVLSTLVETFRDSVSQWYLRWENPGEDADRNSLRAICRNFDSIYEYLPLSRLRALSESAATQLAHQDTVADFIRDNDVRGQLDRFGDRVFREMIRLPAVNGGH